MNGFLFIIFGGFMTTQVQDGLITASVVKQMFGDISDMSLWRWVNDPKYKYMNFPQPFYIATHKYWRKNAIENFIAAQEAQ